MIRRGKTRDLFKATKPNEMHPDSTEGERPVDPPGWSVSGLNINAIMNDDRFKLIRAVRAAALAREVEYLARQSLRPPLADGEGSAGSRMQEPSPSMPISNFLMHSNSSNLAPLRQPSPTPPALPEPALNPAKRRRVEDDDHGTAAALLGLSSPWMSPLLTGTSPLLMGVNLEKCVSLLDTPDLVGLGTPLNAAALPPPLPTVESSDVSLCASPSLASDQETCYEPNARAQTASMLTSSRSMFGFDHQFVRKKSFTGLEALDCISR